MYNETKTTLRLTGDVQEGVGALAPSDFGVNVTIHQTAHPLRNTRRSGWGEAASKTVVGKITPLKILLNELEPGYEVLKPIPVAIRGVDGGFVASFLAANVNSSGDTWDEAVVNLQSLLASMFGLLLAHRPEKLGPAPKRQLSVLQSFIQKTEDAN